ncbi:MAG: hypothetical protein RL497_2934 [Pseudomonadota bacterium]
MYDLSAANQSKITAELKPGESVSWSDQPDPSAYAKGSIITTLFFIPFTAFALFWMASAADFKIPDLSKGGGSLFPLFGLPFLLVGLWGFFQPFRMKKNAASVIYVITNKRVIIIQGNRSISYQSFYPDQLKNIARTQNADNMGNVYFSNESYTDSDGNSSMKKIGFVGIANVQHVEQLIRKLAGEQT